MNDDTLKTLLSAYAAPTPEDGFSDQVMNRVEKEAATPTVDLSEFKMRRRQPWHGWVLAAILGLLAGLIWVRLGISVPDLPDGAALPGLLDSGWGLYALFGLCLAGTLLFIEAEAY
mgnify:CR=1 FL=1